MPIWPLVRGVSRMKMMPGTRIRPENRKNQLRFPMMSNTCAVLPSGEPAAHRSGLEFFVAHAEEPGLLGGLPFDNERRSVRDTVTAVNIEVATPMMRTR